MNNLSMQGHGHFEHIGLCPHCNSHRIRLRRDPWDANLWRCRTCNRTFRTPLLTETLVPTDHAKLVVYAAAIPKMELRARRRQQRRGHGPSVRRWVAIVVVLALMLMAVGVGLAWLNWGSGAARGDEAFAGTGAVQDPAPTPTRTPRPYIVVPTVAPTPIPPPAERHLHEKEYMLELINAERVAAGVSPVVLGTNIAAQLHAESALEHCFGSHWGVDGLKPYMRYSLAGGYQANAENAHGSDYCFNRADGYRGVGSIRVRIDEAIAGWMDSSGHRENMLDPLHKKVNIGLAWDSYNFKAFQHFEGDHVTLTTSPTIEGGVLSIAGELKNGAAARDLQDLGVQLYYDPPPQHLTLGQVSRTYCYDSGLQVASLREPLTGGEYWASATFTTSYSPCPDPYAVAPTAPQANSPDEADRLWQYAYDQSESKPTRSISVPWVTADRFTVQRNNFAVEVNVGWILRQHGPGVYTVAVWANIGSERSVVAKYSIFHGVEPPVTYARAA